MIIIYIFNYYNKMSYNNQPDWETYKPAIKEEELYECEVCDTKTKTITKSYGALDMEICKDCLDEEYEKEVNMEAH